MVANKATLRFSDRDFIPNLFDFFALALVCGILVAIVYGARASTAPLAVLVSEPISLEAIHLPEYALRTVLRMFAALFFSIVFTLIYAPLAAKSRRAEMVMIPILDVLQSVPILGFLTFTTLFFRSLFPGQILGDELACVFAIFTSQAWNMTFSLYQSLRTVPEDLNEACQSFHLSGWQKFWTLELPFSMPGLVWNTMMSMSGGWFFVVASEAITVNGETDALPGIGSYVALALSKTDIGAILWALLTMAIVILMYDQIIFRPIIAWSDKFRVEQIASVDEPESFVLDFFRRTRALRAFSAQVGVVLRIIATAPFSLPKIRQSKKSEVRARAVNAIWFVVLTIASLAGAWLTIQFLGSKFTPSEVGHVIILTIFTLIRVLSLIALATIIWVPIGVWIGLRPKIAEKIQPLVQFLAAFPANLFFPPFVIAIVAFHLDPNIWLSPLMILGTQWYILFNVIAGASAFPSDLREVAEGFHVTGWKWWRNVILPGIFPYYITGAITASGGSWNASIVGEIANWGDTTISADGIGSYIAQATATGDFQGVVLGIFIMCLVVISFNRFVWHPLQNYGERRFNLS